MNDIILTTELDPMVANGDFVAGESLGQAEQLLLLTGKGEWKQTPTAGVGLADYVEGHSESDMCREIRQQMEMDGIRVRRLTLTDGKLEVDSEWK